ncbi:MAG: hypothetical protein K9J16_14405 [Melioribacteraceae bacterium]|nr:hypothetical protein [Melioribacteraceae bacterium]MCF8354448.1 hypothetical protein [Melioribacteraceae bacterium]MCF8394058.1 hypothetical protein [Melioribacteraceae bacterium]MCF8419824.1 hypothetical protein [Melioribacteraceae bacterium]
MSKGLISSEIGKTLNEAFKYRAALDYHDFAKISKANAKDLYKNMKIFVDTVDKLISQKITSS